MALQYSANTVNAKLDAVETNGGTAPLLTLRTGAVPANCSTANAGSLIASMTLPSDWMNGASGGTKTKLGTWSNTSVGGTGTIGHFRLHNSAGTECLAQGNCSNTGSGGDMTLDNTVVNAGQSITVTTFTLTAGNYP